MTKNSSNLAVGLASVAILTVFCQISLLPLLISGVPVNDNFLFNASWMTEFSSQFRGGDLYPRWLANYSNDLGAPVFYFYAPAPFFLESFFGLICPACDLRWSMTLSHIVSYFLSGAAFFLWARSFASWRSSLIGALLYMLAPYHLVDLEQRGSFGEAFNFILAPLALLSLSTVRSGARFPILGVVSYAGMIFSHLPTALLFAPVLLTFDLASSGLGERINAAVRVIQIGIGGVLLAAAYILPAILLREYLIEDGWIAANGVSYHPVDWLLFREGALDHSGEIVKKSVVAIFALSTNAALVAIAALIAARIIFGIKGDFFEPAAAQYFRGAIAALVVCWLLMTEMFYWLYAYVEPFRQIQFPWRLGIFLELAAVTIVTLAIDRIGRLLARQASAPVRLASIAISLVSALTIAGVIRTVSSHVINVSRTTEPELVLAGASSDGFDFGMPQGHRIFAEYPVEYRSKWLVESETYVGAPQVAGLPEHDSAYLYWKRSVLAKPPVEVEDPKSLQDAPEFVQSGPTQFSLTVNLVAPATVKVRRVYFPSWRLRDELSGNAFPVWPSEEHGLIEFKLPAGDHHLLLEIVPLRVEIVGTMISLMMGLGLIAIWIRRRGDFI